MKISTFLISFSFCFAIPSFACDRPIDDKKIVLFVGFHGGNEEIKGAIEGACKRGERLVTIPDLQYMKDKEKQEDLSGFRKAKAAYAKAYAASDICQTVNACRIAHENLDKAVKEYAIADNRLQIWTSEHSDKKKTLEAITGQLEKMKAHGAQLSSIILSGHDGGGHFYGDSDGITKEKIFLLASQYPEQLNSMSSLLLMGCWSAVPKEVDEWKTAFPRLKIVGGFVGSAPAVERPAGAHFISDILASEKKIGKDINQKAVGNILSAVRDLKMITSGVYIDTTKSGCNGVIDNTNQYYYVSNALKETEVDKSLIGLHPYKSTASSEAELQCKIFDAQFDWKTIDSYYSGEKEPDNTTELKSLYSSLRNHEHCFSNHYAYARHSSEQVLFLRFFPGIKKNFAKYFDKEIQEHMDELKNLNKDNLTSNTRTYIENYLKNPISGDSLAKMNRQDLLKSVSNLEQIKWRTPYSQSRKIQQMVNLANTYLYRLECMDPTWHEYIVGATLTPPKC